MKKKYIKLIIFFVMSNVVMINSNAQFSINIKNAADINKDEINLPAKSTSSSSAVPILTNEINKIFNRLQALPSIKSQEFNLPHDSLPPPQPGNTVTEKFPPVEQDSTPSFTNSTGELKVLRYSPEGEIAIAPFISVSFNQAMVPLTTLDNINEQDVPVEIEPKIIGKWKWLGTKTLTFEADGEFVKRIPQATKFTISIRAGTKSIAGNTLSKSLSWSFSTPPVKISKIYPRENEIQPLNTIIFIEFNQRIDSQKILEIVKLKNSQNEIKIRHATEKEIAENSSVKNLVKNAKSARWIAIKATEDLSANTHYIINIGPNIPSAEGPIVNPKTISQEFKTYPPFKINRYFCDWGASDKNKDCQPLMPMNIQLNHAINSEKFDESMVQLTPEVPNQKISAEGNRIVIRGETKGQSNYEVKLSAEIEDIYGQKLPNEKPLEFQYGKAKPLLSSSPERFLTLDPFAPADKKAFSFYAINYEEVTTSIYRVKPEDWSRFNQYVGKEIYEFNDNSKMPGEILEKQTRKLNLHADELTQIDIDLSKYVNSHSAQLVVIVEPPATPKPTDENLLQKWKNGEYQRRAQTIIKWIQISPIAMDVFTSNEKVFVWASEFKTGKPLDNVNIISKDGTKALTDINGLAVFNNLKSSSGEESYFIAKNNNEVGFFPLGINPYKDFGRRQLLVINDREVYRPGEEISIKAWLRQRGAGANGDITMINTANVEKIKYQFFDITGNKFSEGEVSTNIFGAFDLTIKIPEKINLGTGHATFVINNNPEDVLQNTHQFQIQEFRRPEFEVKNSLFGKAPFYIGDKVDISVNATYYAGGSLPNAKTNWSVNINETQYSPPKWEGFVFGEWKPFWLRGFSGYFPTPKTITKTQNFSGQTNSDGEHLISVSINKEASSRNQENENNDDEKLEIPINVNANATVTDVNRQRWTSSSSFIVHPANVYVGLRSNKYFVEKGENLKIEYIVSDIDGKAVSGRKVRLEAYINDTVQVKGKWKKVKKELQSCEQISSDKIGVCEFSTKNGGEYIIKASVWDAKERINQSQITRWVSGGKLVPNGSVEQEKVTLIPDKESYVPGETAKILVLSPFANAYGLASTTRDGLIKNYYFSVDGNGSYVLSIPITEEQTPNINLRVNVNGVSTRGEDKSNIAPSHRPAYAVGNLKISIPPLSRTLDLQVTPQDLAIAPAEQAVINVELKDYVGKFVQDAEVTIMMVDEAVLSLSNYQLADPIKYFYTDRSENIQSAYARASILLLDSSEIQAFQEQNEMKMGYGKPVPMMAFSPAMLARSKMETANYSDKSLRGANDIEQNANSPIFLRTNFNPLAVFAPGVITNAEGKAQIKLKVPDNLTRYRIMAIAVDKSGKRFGKAESNLTVRLPLMVRPSAPRFLNFGDNFELPVIVQNQTNGPLTAQVVARAQNLDIIDKGYQVEVPANDRVEVRFRAQTSLAGTANIQFAVNANKYADSAEVSLPVYTPATTEAFATYGMIDDNKYEKNDNAKNNSIDQSISFPKNTFPQYGGLEISTSSTALQSLTDALVYLVNYPFECSEQLASKIMSISALKDVLSAFNSKELPAQDKLDKVVNDNIKTLQSLQNNDGGYPYWSKSRQSIPYNSVFVTHALIVAKSKGYDVSKQNINIGLLYLKNIEQYYPDFYSQETKTLISTYALFVRYFAGDKDVNKAEKLISKIGVDKLSLDALAWLLPIITTSDNSENIKKIIRVINNKTIETAGGANFTNNYREDESYLFLGSDRKSDALILAALIDENPKNELIPKVVKGLQAHKTKGRWGNTQENVFVLLALDKYFQTYENTVPDFISQIWFGDTYAGKQEFRGYTGKTSETIIPMSLVQKQSKNADENLIIKKEGKGRLYYRLGLRYAPTELKLPALDNGFTVARTYSGAEKDTDVTRNPDGSWQIKSGAKVLIKVKMVSTNRRYHVALTDPLPAGLEIINPALAVSEPIDMDIKAPAPHNRHRWWNWFEHQNLRDQRVEAFSSLLWEGVYEYSYFARATTPGRFVVPPAKAEEMYSPEVFGRSSGDIVIVE